MKLVERDGIKLREAAPWRDDLAYSDAVSYRAVDVREGDRVLDLGAHIGCFTRRVALPADPALVVCLEPHPGNFDVLVENCGAYPNVVLRCEAVSGLGGDVSFFESAGNSLTGSMYVRRGRVSLSVPSVTLDDLLDEYEPDVLKIDVEGAEYELGLDRLPGYVRAVAIELHFLGSEKWRAQAQRLVPRIEASGLRPTKPVNVSGSNWNPVAIFKRS